MRTNIPKDAFAIIIGAMKCGTTSIYNYLCQHPQVRPALVKEPEFFSENQNHRLDCESYEQLWSFKEGDRIALEASTGYTKYPLEIGVPARMFQYGIYPKFIYCVRNPIDRIISQHEYAKRFDWGDQEITSDQLIKISSYWLQLSQFRRFFSKDRILILDFEELTTQPIDAINRVFSFLDLEPFDVDYSLIYNKAGVTDELGNNLNGGDAFLRTVVTDNLDEFLRESLKADMCRFRDEYSFDVGKWGF